MNDAVTLIVYLRSGCSLCNAMMNELTPLQQRYGFRIEAVDIDVSPELVARYGEWIPVLVGPDGELCHYFLNPDVLHRYFAAH